MSASLRWEGLEELRAALRNLPAALTAEGGALVETRGAGAAATIRDGYPARTQDLRNKVKVEHTQSAFGARSVITNTSRHALPFESGTQARHTALGANRGSMPPNPLFSETIRRARRALNDDLRGLLTRAGLLVTGDA